MVCWDLKNTKVVYGKFFYNFIPLQPCFGLRRNNAYLLGNCGQLVLLGLVPTTTETFQNYYGGIIFYLKHNKIPYTLNFQIINSFGHVTQVCTTLANF